MESLKKVISLNQAAEISGYSQDYLGYLIRRGEVKGIKKGRVWFTTEKEVKKYLSKKKNLHKKLVVQDSLKVISLNQGAKISGYTQDYLGSLIRKGEMKGEKIGSNWVTTEEDIKKYISKKKAPHKKLVLKDLFSHFLARNILIYTLIIFVGLSSVGFYIFEKYNINSVVAPTSQNTKKIREVYFSVTKNIEELKLSTTASVFSPQKFSLKIEKFAISVGDEVKFVGHKIASGWNKFAGRILNKTKNFLANLFKPKNSSTKIVVVETPTSSTLVETPEVEQEQSSTIIQKIIQTGLTGKTGPRGEQGLRGFIGLQGLTGPQGPAGISIDTTPFVLKSFLTMQVDKIFDSIARSTQGLSNSLSEEVNTDLLTVSGNATIGGDITITGNMTGNVVGTINPSFTIGSIPFQGASNLSQDNANLFWDATNSRLGIGTTDLDGTPTVGKLTIKGTTNDGTTNILVGRDSDEVNVFSVDTNGLVTTAGLTSSLLIGGSAIDSKITYKSTTGAGTVTDIAHQFVGGTDGGTVAMTILNDGNIGIGTITNPVTALNFPATSDITKGISFGNGDSKIYAVNDTGITFSTGATPSTVLLQGGVMRNGNGYMPGIRFSTTSSATVPTLTPRYGDADTGIGGPTGGDELSFIAGGVEGQRITEVAGDITHYFAGNVGIGTTSAPAQKLDITGGSIRLDNTTGASPTGIIYKGSTPFVSDFNYGNNGTVTTNGKNTFVGIDAGNLTMGSTATDVSHSSYNTAIGNGALTANTKGYQNTAIGLASLFSNTTGYNNTANGLYSLHSNTTGYQNTANGMYSLRLNTVGYNNSAQGYASLYANTQGSYNSAQGYYSLYANTGGTYNSAIGYQAGRFTANGSTGNTTSDYSLYLGTNTKAGADGNQNEIVIGYDAIGNGSNSVTLGNTSITKTILQGNVGIGTITPTANFQVAQGTAGVGTVSNSAGGTTVTGIGTQFTNTFKVGDTITINGETVAISAIASDTSMTTAAITGANSGVAYTLTGGTRFSVLGNGNVGIGTTSPGRKLDVNGAISAMNGQLVLEGDNISYTTIQSYSGLKLILNGAGNNIGIGLYSPTAVLHLKAGTTGVNTAPLKFTSGALNTIAEAGAIEFLDDAYYGTITTGAERKQFAFTSDITNSALLLDQTTPQTITGGIPIFGAGLTSPLLIGGSAIDSKITYKSTTGAGTATGIAHQFVGGTDGGTTAMTILNNGNVGIGTTEPVSKINIFDSSTNAILTIHSDNADTNHGELAFRAGRTGSPILASDSIGKISVNSQTFTAGDFSERANIEFLSLSGQAKYRPSSGIIFRTSLQDTDTLNEAMRINQSGNVGIGTITPTANFQVAQGTAGVGTVSNSAGGTTVTGIGTQFTNTFKVGDTITINGETVAISAIASDTSMTTAAITGANSGVAYTLTGGTRFSVLGNGNVGIGTTSPGAKLSIETTLDPNTYPSLTLNNSASLGNSITFKTNGVKMGQFRADQGGSLAFEGGGNGGIHFNYYGSTGDVIFWKGKGTGAAASEQLITVKNTGNVGIGVTSPTAVLHLKAGTTGVNTAPLKFTSGALNTIAEAGAIEFLDDAYYGTITTGAERKQFAFTSDITNSALLLDQTTPQTITGGIPIFGAGLTSPLLIGGSAIDSKITYKSTTGAGTATGIAHQFVGGTDGGTTAMTILNNGNVGIGTTGTALSPTNKINIEDSSTTPMGLSIYNTSTGSAATAQVSLRSANATLVLSASNYYATGTVQALTGEKLALGANYGVGMTFDTSNNVGIGTTSPGAKLEVLDTSQSVLRGMINTQVNNNPHAAQMYFQKARGSVGALTTVVNGDYTGFFGFNNYDGSNYLTTAGFGAKVNGTVTTGSIPTELFFYTSSTNQSDPYSAGAVRMVINKTGNVGIGTITPTANFQVAQGTAGVGTVSNSAGGTTVTGIGTQFTNTFKVGDTITINGETVAISAIASDTSMTTAAITGANSGVAYTLTGGTRFSVLGNGNVGIGTTGPSYKLHVSDTTTAGIVGAFTNSDGSCTLDPGDVGGWSCSSDISLKKDITDIDSGLAQINQLRPVNFHWLSEDETAMFSMGFIAQEVQPIFPKLVTTQFDGTLSLNYGGFTPIIIKAIQDIDLKLEDLTNMEVGFIDASGNETFVGRFFSRIESWLGDVANGIENLYVKVAHSNKSSTKELCVIDDSGAETCITKTQLDNILLNVSANAIGSSTPNPVVEETVVVEPAIEPITEPASEPVAETVVEEPVTEPIVEPVPEPVVEPVTEPVVETTPAI